MTNKNILAQLAPGEQIKKVILFSMQTDKLKPYFMDSYPALFICILLCSTVVSLVVIRGKYAIIIALLGLFLWWNLSLNFKMGMIILGTIYPLSFGNVGPIVHFYWWEWMGPLMLLWFFLKFARERQRLVLLRSGWLISAVLALLITVIVNYYRNPVLAEKLMGASSQAGGLRSYFDIVSGLCLLIVFMWYMRFSNSSIAFWNSFFKIIAVFSILLGIIRIATYFMGIDMPCVYSVFHFGLVDFEYGGSFRIGGLTECAVFGSIALLTDSYKRSFKKHEFAMVGIFILLLIMGGGRTDMVVFLAIFLVFAWLSGFKKLFRYVFTGIFIGIFILGLNLAGCFGNQLERLLAFGGNAGGLDIYRITTYKLMWNAFLNNPLFGKGIGFVGQDQSNTLNFALNQLKAGGHGSYMSMLAIFGVFGFYFLLISILGAFKFSLKFLRPFYPVHVSRVALFTFLTLLAIALRYITGGNGYSDPKLYMLVGLIAGLNWRLQREKIHEAN